jgi:hypothetical protein
MLLTSGSLREYFTEALGQAMGESMVKLTQSCQLYLINLLNDFSRSENVYAGTDYGENPALAILLSRAADAEPQEAVRIYKHLGDSSLYLSGFFNESVGNQAVSVDYYQSMGESAYAQVAGQIRHSEATSSALYMELAHRFGDLISLLNAISFHGPKAAPETTGLQDKEIFDLVKRYRRTQNPEILKVLNKTGVSPLLGLGTHSSSETEPV